MIDRHQYVEKLKAQLDAWDQDLDSLETRVKATHSDLQQRSQQALDDLKTTRRQLNQRLHEVVSVSDDAWQRLRLSLDAALDNVRSGLASVRAELLPPKPEASKTDQPRIS